jgi:hypothetical protein
MTKSNSGIIKFSIGVTGHRDVAKQSYKLLRRALETQIQDIQNRFSTLPVEVVCGLAEGADILVAQVALEMGIHVRAILPMPLEQYKEDFSEAGLKEFEEIILHQGVELTEIPINVEQNLNRDSQYVLLKDYIFRRSNVLLALWDNQVTGLPGGTSDVVLEYLSEDCTAPYIISETNVSRTTRSATDDDDGNFVIAIYTPREATTDLDGIAQIEYLVSDGAPNALASLNAFPHKVRNRWQGFEKYVVDRQSNYATEYISYDLYEEGDQVLDEILQNLNGEFVRADQLAMANQKFSDYLFKGFALAAGAMGFFFLAYAKLAAIKIFLLAYLCLFAVGYILFKLSKSRGWFGKHLAYRALAEAFRIKYYLTLSGNSGGVPCGRLLKMTRINRFKGIEWLYDVIRCSEPLQGRHNSPEGIDLIKTRWIKGQSDYLTKKLHALHKQHSRLEKIKNFLFFSSFTGILALLFFKKELYHMHLFSLDGKTLLVFLMGLLPLWLALWELYQSKMAVRELSWQYANQQSIFAEASRRMSEKLNSNSYEAIILGLAESSLTEVFQWTAQRFHREHEPPSAG